MDQWILEAHALAVRREMLCKKAKFVVPCPNCGEMEQIQLIAYVDVPAEWKCRKCKHRWKHEP